MRTGIDRQTGRVLTDWDHCAQSIMTIVTTAIGSRVLSRSFGSGASGLQDRPQNAATVMDHYVAIAEALRKWEPGFRLRKVCADRLGIDGVAVFSLSGDYYPNGHVGDYARVVKMQTLSMTVVAVSGALSS